LPQNLCEHIKCETDERTARSGRGISRATDCWAPLSPCVIRPSNTNSNTSNSNSNISNQQPATGVVVMCHNLFDNPLHIKATPPLTELIGVPDVAAATGLLLVALSNGWLLISS